MAVLARMHGKILFYTALLSASGIGLAAQPAGDIKPQVANLVSSPGRCELRPGQTICRMQMHLIWEAPTAAHYCLWRRGQEKPIQCWDNAWRGSAEVEFVSGDKLWFELRSLNSDVAVAEAGVSVTGSYKQRKRAERRKRGFWRMF